MINIDWDEFKEYKLYSVRDDNFLILIDFLKSYYSLSSSEDMFETLQEDVASQMMLKKREILDVEDLEIFLRKQR